MEGRNWRVGREGGTFQVYLVKQSQLSVVTMLASLGQNVLCAAFRFLINRKMKEDSNVMINVILQTQMHTQGG